MTQFSKLYLKLDKEKEHLITFNYSEKYSICRQGVGVGSGHFRQGWSGQSGAMKESFQLLSFYLGALAVGLQTIHPRQTFNPNLQLLIEISKELKLKHVFLFKFN